MSKMDNGNYGALVPADRTKLVGVLLANPLVTRGIADIHPPEHRRGASFFFNRGMGWIKEKLYDKAMKDFDEAIRLDPTHGDAYGWRGKVWCFWGFHGKAMKDFDEAIRIEPGNAVHYCHRGACGIRGTDASLNDLEEAVRLNPGFGEAYYERGVARVRKTATMRLDLGKEEDLDEYIRRLGEGIGDREISLRIDPTLPEDGGRKWVNAKGTGIIVARQVPYGGGKKWAYAEAYRQRAFAYWEKRAYGEAIKDYDQAVRLDPENEDGLVGYAWMLATCPEENVRGGQRAIQLATKACELTKWKCGRTLNALAAAYAEIGRFGEAVHYQTRALEATPDRVEFRQRLELFKQKKPFRQGTDQVFSERDHKSRLGAALERLSSGTAKTRSQS